MGDAATEWHQGSTVVIFVEHGGRLAAKQNHTDGLD
jgi:hypothetical protein